MSVYIGIMSGTSLDAIDVAACQFNPFRLIASHSIQLPNELKQSLMQLCRPGPNEIERIAIVSQAYTRLVSQAVIELSDQLGSSVRLAGIGFHGQTIRHMPQHGFSFQLGDPALLAELSQATVVANFRQTDLAAGGQGAPLVPTFHAQVFGSNEPRVVLNLGGIANVSVLTEGRAVSGFDTGPANLLMDGWCLKHTGQPFDRDGAWASSGSLLPQLLAQMLSEPYFALSPPKSTGRELFNLQWLEQFSLEQYDPADVQRTLLELTARSVCDSLEALELTQVSGFVCGGGAYNQQLMDALMCLLPDLRWRSTETIGLAPTWVEASAFAWLACQRLNQKDSNEPAVTGAKGYRSLGAVYRP